MSREASKRCVAQVSGCPDDLRLGDCAADATCARGASVARHGHVGDPIFLGRGIR